MPHKPITFVVVLGDQKVAFDTPHAALLYIQENKEDHPKWRLFVAPEMTPAE